MQNEFIDLGEAAKRSPGRPHASAVWRWCRRGIKTRVGHRVFLQHYRAGARIFIKPEWLGEFFAAISKGDAAHFAEQDGHGPVSHSRTPLQKRKAIAAANAELAAEGI